MPLEERYSAIHRREHKHHRLRLAQSFVFLPDLIEMHSPGAPALVKILDAGTTELGLSLAECHEIRA
jgi:hypothetical protein